MIKVNNKEIIFERFPNNETLLKNQFSHIIEKSKCFVKFKYEDDSDLIKLMLIKKRIDEIFTGEKVLEIMYMPYSRMDRGSDEIIFTLKYISGFINSLKFDTVIIYEPHSNKCLELINNSIDLYYTKDLFYENKTNINPDYILFPDKGAYDRYSGMFEGFDTPIIYANKTRNFATGKIENLEIVGDIKKFSTVVIIDDMSSYGGTFIWAAEKLKEKGCVKTYLIIGHAENSILDGKIPESNLIEKFLQQIV